MRRALLLKGIDFQLREPNGPEDYRRWSPDTGLLPVLEIDGQRTADSTDILFRLDALCPNPPSGPGAIRASCCAIPGRS